MLAGLQRADGDTVISMPEYNRFSKGLFSWIGFPSVTIPLTAEKRQAGASTWTFRKLLNYAFDGLLSFNNKPLRLAVYGGLLLTLRALGYAVWVVANAVLNGVDMPGEPGTHRQPGEDVRERARRSVTAPQGGQALAGRARSRARVRLIDEITGRPPAPPAPHRGRTSSSTGRWCA